MVACAITIIGLEYLYRRTLVGRAFMAIAEDNFAARALGLPERNLRVASYALAGVIGGVAGFSGGELLLAFFANGALLELLWLRAGGARRPRQQPRRHHRRPRARPVPAGREFPGRRHLLVGCGVHAVHRRSAGGAARPVRRGHGTEGVMTAVIHRRTAHAARPAPARASCRSSRRSSASSRSR